jgi:hypothetical protein
MKYKILLKLNELEPVFKLIAAIALFVAKWLALILFIIYLWQRV